MKKGKKVRGVFQRDGQWWIRWVCTLGHDHRKPSGAVKMEAAEEHKAKRAEVREARKSGLESCPRLSEPTRRPTLFDDILADYMEHSQRTKRSHSDDRPKRARFSALYGKRLVSSITSKDIEDFKASFAQEPLRRKVRRAGAAGDRATVENRRTVATVNHYLKFLKAVFNRAIRHGHLTYNPVRAVKLYREHNARNRCLSPEEEVRLMAALPSSLAPFVMMALHTGMRRGELRALRWDDVDFSTGTLRIRQDKAGDGAGSPSTGLLSMRSAP